PQHQPAAPARLSLTFLRTTRYEAKASPGPLSSWEGGGRTQQIPGGDAAPEDLARPLAGAILVALTVPSPPALPGAGRGPSPNPATATRACGGHQSWIPAGAGTGSVGCSMGAE